MSRMRRRRALPLLPLLLICALLPLSSPVRPFVIVITGDDLKETPSSDSLPSSDPSSSSSEDHDDGDPDWDEFSSSSSSSSPASDDLRLDPGSWLSVLDPSFSNSHLNSSSSSPSDGSDPDPREALFVSGINAMLAAASAADPAAVDAAASQIEVAAAAGLPHAHSALAFLRGYGVLRPLSRPRAFLHHRFAAEGGNPQSKMALAYTYFRQAMYEKAVVLYAELAETAMMSFLISKEPPVIEPVRLHSGTEENKDALRKSRGEEDEDFQITEYQAQRGNSAAMFKIGLLYYYGLRGLRRNHTKALHWFSKAVEKGDTRSMEFLGEIYARGAGVERNYTKAFEWLSRAAKQQYYSAYNGLGYLYVKGYGVEKKNLTKAREYFEIAAEQKEPGGHYNLGVLYLKGLGVKRDVKAARNFFLAAANAGQPKALYQVAKLFQKGIGLKKNLYMATLLYKAVAERGPWSSLSRWALESYLKGDMGKALLLYSRMAELGYEVAQSNAAWILDRYGEQSICMGESGFCTDAERHLRAHSLWWQASEQGNEHAALLIGDAYYYGRGIERDYERAAEAYMHAQSQLNAQAMFNLGYMHEHGQGLPLDLHLAKRYYDQALEIDPAAKLPVTLALMSLWLRKNYAGGFVVNLIDSLPEVYPRIEEWVEDVILDEGNATILTLFACLLTVLYLRERQRRQAAVHAQQPPDAGQ
ncbi:ERAD-associated E3 ubiquitin-protein ligase component HRD3 isoform X3 [Ananas comosus]|uniref:ERAD-associated E3 ubiquitin-protein ligase component HRD3 isoform X2 n=1 Tax=Ananas comosus TaxID=4615 RepID=A0A6P5EGB6_ANACO|nr:ERAD-associated E3 ubiquitin-protein ligase component HRD3 isoform X2 [Ananas comosus]XP_020082531.1 ERAD-associated E3 ubiquitin-protein ligase component HRD3 isoform X3 [Ananas comosus]